MFKVLWKVGVTNDEILYRVGRDRELLHSQNKKNFILGSYYKEEPSTTIHNKRKIEEKRRIGRKKLSWLRNIRGWTSLTFEDRIRSAAK